MGGSALARPKETEAFELSLVLTHACNLACPYCYMGEHHATHMPPAIADRAIDLAFSRSDDVRVSFFGGEPLLAWDELVRIAARAEERATGDRKKVSFQVTTNATLMTDARAAWLASKGARIAVSLDGTRAAHESGRPTRGGASSFDAVLAGIACLRAAEVPFDVIAVTAPANAALLGESVRFLASLDPARIILNPAFGEAWSDEAIAAWEHGLREAAAAVLAAWRAEAPVYVNAFDGKLAAAAKGESRAHCSVGRWNVAVAPSGNLYACDRLVGDDRPGAFVAGNIANGLDLDRMLDRGTADPECAPCAERPRCRSTCACANIAETGKSDMPGGVQCWYEQTTARLADEIGWALVDERNVTFVERAYGADVVAHVARPRRLPLVRDPAGD